MDIHSSTFNSNQQELQDVQIHISSSDLAMADIFSVPKEEQSNLVTLEEYVVEKEQHSNSNIDLLKKKKTIITNIFYRKY